MLLDRFLPDPDVSKRHSIVIPAPRERVFDDPARRKFLLYWRLIEPFSGLICRSLLSGVRRSISVGASPPAG